MREYIINGYTLPAAYHKALAALHLKGEEVPCPDYDTIQKEISVTMIVEQPLSEPMISRLMIAGAKELEQYRQEMLDGILDFEVERGNWSYTYHDRMAWQIPCIIEELKRNPYSRRAAIDIRTASDLVSDDPACLQHIQYFIRDDQLHCKVLFRSNDACKAAYMNAFALIMLQKRIADQLGVGMGTYTHRANSFHCYAKDYGLLAGYMHRYISGEKTTYSYVGEWDELMEEAKPEIAAMVAKLKGGQNGDSA
jgi:thymidylate synthase